MTETAISRARNACLLVVLVPFAAQATASTKSIQARADFESVRAEVLFTSEGEETVLASYTPSVLFTDARGNDISRRLLTDTISARGTDFWVTTSAAHIGGPVLKTRSSCRWRIRGLATCTGSPYSDYKIERLRKSATLKTSHFRILIDAQLEIGSSTVEPDATIFIEPRGPSRAAIPILF